jgi:hypothetical protein
VRSHVFASRLNPYRERKLTVIGSKAMAVFDDVAPWNQKLAVFHHKLWEDDNGWQSEMVDPDYVDLPDGMPLTRECAHFRRVHPRREPSRARRSPTVWRSSRSCRKAPCATTEPPAAAAPRPAGKGRRRLARLRLRNGPSGCGLQQDRKHRLGRGRPLGAIDEPAAEHPRLVARPE